MRSHPFHWCSLDVRHRVKGDYFRTLISNDCPARFQTCLGPVAPFFGQFLPFGMETFAQCLYPYCVLELINLFFTLRAHRQKDLALSQMRLWTWTFELILKGVKTFGKYWEGKIGFEM